ncbi:putative CoA transferase [Escherichia coli]|uniref:Putative CoA transferase n=1 Tax=Escherichia coli TaxID=562 RepID=A0A377K652_ECOLX|nr:putative CoA transferase [Escherichia coli]STP19756.1 putative CoA transferase [Escherichia coli]
MKPVKPPRINGRVPVLSAQEAVNYIPDEATLCVLGAGGGILEATTLITALADKYKQTQTPRNLSIISPTGLGDRADRGISPLAQEGLVKWALCGHWGQSPRISDLAEQNKLLLITIHKVYLHKPYAPPQPTSLVLLVILASEHLSIHASKAAN